MTRSRGVLPKHQCFRCGRWIGINKAAVHERLCLKRAKSNPLKRGREGKP